MQSKTVKLQAWRSHQESNKFSPLEVLNTLWQCPSPRREDGWRTRTVTHITNTSNMYYESFKCQIYPELHWFSIKILWLTLCNQWLQNYNQKQFNHLCFPSHDAIICTHSLDFSLASCYIPLLFGHWHWFWFIHTQYRSALLFHMYALFIF